MLPMNILPTQRWTPSPSHRRLALPVRRSLALARAGEADQ